jgi:multisubunit Na+/H+ antiporter MnhB subunit
MSFEFYIANRYLKSKRKTGFISLITYISILGVMIGVAALIIVLSVMNGFEKEVRSRFIGFSSHIDLTKFWNEPFSNYDEITEKIAEIVTPKHMKSEVQIVYQTVDNLHKSCPEHLGDWYFTGNYPTPGGNSVVNKAFMNYMEGLTVRAY